MGDLAATAGSRLPQYAQYRATGGSHFGRAPTHWMPMRFGALGRLISGGTPSSERADFWAGDIPWISAKDMKVDVIEDVPDHVSGTAVRESGLRLVPAGSLVFVVRGMILAHSFPVARVTRPVTVNQDLKGLVPRRGVSSEFLSYLFRGLRDLILSMTDEAGHGTRRLRMDWWRPAHVEIPPEPEQQAIAAFLDRETARIDELVAKQERQIELLRERRVAIISGAFLRGLREQQTRPTGISWMPEIPAAWDAPPLKHWIRAPLAYGVLKPDKYSGPDSVPLVRIMDVDRGLVALEQLEVISPAQSAEFRRTIVQPGDLIVSVVGTLGRCFIVPVDLAGANLSRALARVQLRRSADARFVAYFLESHGFREFLELVPAGTAQRVLNLDDLGSVPVPRPPQGERDEIVKALDRATSTIDAARDHIRDLVDRLREYRSALITAAVTGQIDVRGEAAA